MATGRIGATPTLRTRWSKLPTTGTTVLSGLDDNSVALVYDAGYEAVYRNGVLLSRGNDYTATNGTTVTLIDATLATDIIEIFANDLVPLTDAISKGQYNAKGALLSATAASTPAVLTVGTNGQILTADSTAGTGLAWATPAGASFAGVALQNATGNISVANATGVTLTWASERFDVGGYHTGSSSDIVIPSGKAGYYLVTFNFTFSANATGQRLGYIAFNGGSDNCATTLQTTSAEEFQGTLSIVRYCAVADTISGIVYQNSGSTLSIRSAATSTNYAGNSTSLTAIFLGA